MVALGTLADEGGGGPFPRPITFLGMVATVFGRPRDDASMVGTKDTNGAGGSPKDRLQGDLLPR
jgi:hypothetical protein